MKKQELKSIIKECVREVIAESKQINEVDYEKVKVPSEVKRFMDKFTNSLKTANLSKQKQVAVLYNIIKSLGIDGTQLAANITKIKQSI